MSGASQPASSRRLLDLGHGRRRLGQVHRHAQHLGSRACQLEVLLHRGLHVGRVGVAIDWTTMGAPPPTWTLPTRTADGLMPRHALDHSRRLRPYTTAAASRIAPFAARNVRARCASVWAAERNHASNGDGGA